jgi:hypothetical protein
MWTLALWHSSIATKSKHELLKFDHETIFLVLIIPLFPQNQLHNSTNMESVVSSPVKEHRRNKSAVLKSMMPSSKRPTLVQTSSTPMPMQAVLSMSFLPQGHPHSQQRVLSEIPPNSSANQPRRSKTDDDRPTKPLHKRTKSAISLRSLGKSKEDMLKDISTPKSSGRRREKDEEQSPKKKSTRSLTSMFNGKQSKETDEQESSHSDKENSTPPKKQQPVPRTPIYAAYASQQQEVTSTTKIPLNDLDKRRSVIEEIALYDPDPNRMVEAKQRNFHGYDPKLSKPVRSKSEVISNHALGRFVDKPSARKLSSERRPMSYVGGEQAEKGSQENRGPSSKHDTEQIELQKRGAQSKDTSGASRVKDAVARINRRTLKAREEPAVDPEKFSADFEVMLV